MGEEENSRGILEQPLRRKVFNLILLRPGIHFSGIRQELGIDSRTLSLHLDKLQLHGLVRQERINNNLVCFPQGAEKTLDALHFHLNKKDFRCIFEILLEHPGVSMRDLCQILLGEMKRPDLTRKTRRLIIEGLLVGEQENKELISISIPNRLVGAVRKYLQGHRPEEAV